VADRDVPDPAKSKDWELDDATSPPQPPCAYCFNKVDSPGRSVCPRCHAVYHADCWETNEEHCAVYGCVPEAPRTASPRRVPVWIVALGALLVVVAIALLTILRVATSPVERGSHFGLKVYASVQWDFRSNDRGGNGQNAYWRRDIAGLYALKGREGQPIRLIPLAGALADDRPTMDLSAFGPRAPLHGYWFRAIRHADETTEPDPDRFAACAFPEKYGVTGKNTFIISEGNTVFKKDLGHARGIEVFPADPEKEGWRRLD
jgi:hypothetical protein